MSRIGFVYLCVLFMAQYLLNAEGRNYKISKRLVCGASSDSLLKSVLQISETACVDECVWRPSCKALDYSGRLKLCNLYSREDIKLVKGHCNYIKRTNITTESTCKNNCVDGEVCDVTTAECTISGMYVISYEGCPVPYEGPKNITFVKYCSAPRISRNGGKYVLCLECKPLVIENFSFLGNLDDIRSTKREICHNPFGNFTLPLATNPPITCQANGSWNRQPSYVEPYNVAFEKNVTLSSEFRRGRSVGSLMVNGDEAGTWVLACTGWESEPWAVVDLGESHVIYAFKIYNRRDCCPQRLHDLEIYSGDSIESLLLCTNYLGVLDPIMQEIVVSKACYGRHVKLQIVQGNDENILTVCELEVYGTPVIN